MKSNSIIIISIVIVIIIYFIAAETSESNFGCGYCHTGEYDRWDVSTHNTVNCRNCHIDPGITGTIDAQINGLHNLFIAITKGTNVKPHEDPIPISTQNCQGCHAAILNLTELGYEDLPDNSLKVQGLKIGHRVHVEEYNIDCVECHRGVVHRDPGEIGKYAKNFPFMHTDCKSCHDGKYHERFQVEVTDLEDRQKCTTCHPDYIPPDEYEDY